MDLRGLRRRLLGWYARQRRAMPWRAAPGRLSRPYAALVSETMLQQTRVSVVEGYYRRFMRRFPTPRALAGARESDVLALWQGLGYYTRARSLHAAAKMIVREHGGRVPRDVEGLMRLPGVGRYTAGAVASMAFGEPTPVVDGNVKRVLARALGDRRIGKEEKYWELMGRLVQTHGGRFRPGDVNQAVMELGAVVCLPKSPRCGDCPIRSCCAAFADGNPGRFGVRDVARRPVWVEHRVVAVRRETRWLFERRGEGGMWARMWQMPTREGGGSGVGAVRGWFRERFGWTPQRVVAIGGFEHATTHRRIRFSVYVSDAAGGSRCNRSEVWRPLDDVADLPMSNAQRRVLRMVCERVGSAGLCL